MTVLVIAFGFVGAVGWLLARVERRDAERLRTEGWQLVTYGNQLRHDALTLLGQRSGELSPAALDALSRAQEWNV